MKKIPFKFGELVTGEFFTNRKSEITKLFNNFSSLQNTAIISPRRYGKSSLVKEAASRFVKTEKEFKICFLDLMSIYSEEEFYSKFVTTILNETSNKVEEFLQSAKNAIKGAKITINAGTGAPGVEFGVDYIKDNLETILNLPQNIAEKKNKKIIICIDEFQNISRFENNEKLQGRLRSAWQQHSDVGYILYGSKQTMMTEIFNKTNMPFYKFGETIYLNRIESAHLKDFIQNTFLSTGKELSDELSDKVIETVENHPYYLQQFARNIWLIAGKKVTESDFYQAKNALWAENQNFYNETIDGLTNYQVRFIKTLLNKEAQIYSSHIINAYKLGSSANVKRIYNALYAKGIIVKEAGKIIFADPIFKLIAEERFL